MAGIRKRASTKGDVVVEVKPGEEVTSVNVGWTVEKFVEEVKEGKRKEGNGKKRAQASPNGRVKKAAPKKASPKVKKVMKPTKKSTSKKKK